MFKLFFFFFQAEDGIRDVAVTGVQTCALPILLHRAPLVARAAEQVAERRHDLADAADEEAPAAIGVAVDPAARDLVAEPRARHVLEAEARVLPCQGL